MPDQDGRISVVPSSERAERTLQDVAAANPPGTTLRLRFQPQLYKLAAVQGQPGQYIAWRGVNWFLEVPTVEQALDLREALDAFFGAVGRGVPLQVLTDRLEKVKG